MGRAADASSRLMWQRLLTRQTLHALFKGFWETAASRGIRSCAIALEGLFPRVPSIEHLTKALLHRCSNERADELTNTHIPDLCLDD